MCVLALMGEFTEMQMARIKSDVDTSGYEYVCACMHACMHACMYVHVTCMCVCLDGWVC